MKSGWFKKRSATERAAIIAGILGIIGTVLAVVISNVLQPPTVIVQPPTEPTAQPPSESELQFELVRFDDKSEGFPKLEIWLRNTGEKEAFLKSAHFKVEKVWEFPRIAAQYHVTPDYDYDIMLPKSVSPDSIIRINTSESIVPDKLTLITFTLGYPEPMGPDGYVFLMTMELIYDDDKTLTSDNLVFGTAIAIRELRSAIRGDLPEDLLTKYIQTAEEIDGIEGIKNEGLNEALRDILETSIED